jgi:hypothetical protein
MEFLWCFRLCDSSYKHFVNTLNKNPKQYSGAEPSERNSLSEYNNREIGLYEMIKESDNWSSGSEKNQLQKPKLTPYKLLIRSILTFHVLLKPPQIPGRLSKERMIDW